MKKTAVLIACLIFMLFAASCTAVQDADAWKENQNISSILVHENREILDYAQGFAIDHYQDGYVLISISDGSRFLLVPEGGTVPADLDENITVLQRPVEDIYLAATAVMDMFRAIDAVDHIRLSGTKEDGWYIEEAQKAMQEGRLLYAGKYNAPDYELILSEGCRLSIQSTMIHHSPEVKEKLESLGIPVLTDYSSYEAHPLGRCEWVKVYGALTGREEEAALAFAEQKAALEKIVSALSGEDTADQTVAFFYINGNGAVNVRKSQDYVPKMIELAGGRYLFENLGEGEDATSSMNIQMEEFYAAAKDVDYMIYNGTTAGEISTIEELVKKSPLLASCKAVQNGNVWCTTRNMYQSSMEIGTMISDFYIILAEETEDEPVFLYKME